MTPEDIERAFAYGGDFTTGEARNLARQVQRLTRERSAQDELLTEYMAMVRAIVPHVDEFNCCSGLVINGEKVWFGSRQVHALTCPYRRLRKMIGEPLEEDVSPVQ